MMRVALNAWWLKSVWARSVLLKPAMSLDLPGTPGLPSTVGSCRVVDTMLVDQEMVYAPRLSDDRLLRSLKGSLKSLNWICCVNFPLKLGERRQAVAN